jgi:Family of unknown function (DUF6345)
MRTAISFFLLGGALCGALTSALAQTRYSTGAVANYPANPCGGPSLPLTVPEAASFRSWYSLRGLPNVTRWENNDVWGSDFRNGANADEEPGGGSDLPDVYFFTGHGSCQNPPGANDSDFVITCSTNGQPDTTNIGTSSRWGNGNGKLKFAFIDASCPMDLVSLGRNWFPPFAGLHLATGHSGDVNHDTLDSITRGAQFGLKTVGLGVSVLGVTIDIFPELPATWAWMNTGLIDVQSQVCAVAIANDSTQQAAENRRDGERVRSPMGKPSGNWFAWRWICN